MKIEQNELEMELQKIFEVMDFRDFCELTYKVTKYEEVLKEDM